MAAVSPGTAPPVVAWHTLTPYEALSRLDSSAEGLTQDVAAERLACGGPNRLAPASPVSASQILRAQLRSIVVWLLIAATAISLAIGDLAEATAIGAVLVLNTALGFTIDLRARRAMHALLGLDVSRCAVVRDGVTAIVDAQMLVPGDVIEVGRGQSVPADARVLTTHDLRVSEAALTGESMPVSKHATVVLDPGVPLADRVTMIYKGTTVIAGTGRAVVAATGDRTELGRISTLVAAIPEAPTPLERRLDELGRRLVWLVLAMTAAASGLNLLHGQPLPLVLEMGIALAVAAVPEALPAVATIALAIGLRRMAARRALVRRLAAVEALGSVTVVCSDKTRTLTSGDMTLVTVWTPDAVFEPGRRTGEPPAAACAEAMRVAVRASRPPAADLDDAGAVDDPVDRALVRGAEAAGLGLADATGAAPIGIVPFSSERKLAATFGREAGAVVASVKGAPGRIVDLCRHVRRNGRLESLDEAGRAELVAVNERLAAGGLRVLGVAGGPVDQPDESHLGGLTFIGFVGLMDPPADGVRETIVRLRAAGMRTVMLTGDQRNTAAAVGRELGIVGAVSEVIDGRELAGLSPAELRERISAAGAFSRIAPEDKLRVVQSLQEQGDVVAMLGDGVNDAAALKQADVGVAMGRRGTDVAKEAAAIVLQDDRFETIAAAVEEGRVVYDNIRKFVFYLFSCNLAEVLVLTVAGLAALPLPLLPLQILWLNLVTDTFPALALALEPADHDVMKRPPRDPREALLSASFVGSIVFYAVLITVVALAAFLWALGRAPGHATTVCFMTLGLTQIFHLGNARSPHHVLHPSRALANPYALLAVAVAVGLQWLSVAVPGIASTIGLTPLDGTEWLVVVGLAALPALVGQAVKRWPRSTRDALLVLAVTLSLPPSAWAGPTCQIPTGQIPAGQIPAGLTASERAELDALYAAGPGLALWSDASGRLTTDAREAIGVLAAAPDDGLDPADYGLDTLRELAAAVAAAPAPDAERLAAFDVRLSAGMLRYFRHVHRGRVDPRSLGISLDAEPERHAFVGLLQAALAAHDVPAVAATLAPSLPQYQALRRQLARYRAIGDLPDTAWPSVPQAIRPSDRLETANALRQRLAAFGDLPADAPPAADAGVYDDTLVAGVCRFQARHGLASDGVLGRATRAALAVPVRARIRQIELSLERLRWLPDAGDERIVALNIPMFRLGAWDGADASRPALRMRVIVGRALLTETPVFTALMRTVIFRPYWNVPRSILLKEMLPELERDPTRRLPADYEIVDGQSDEADAVPATAAALAGLRAGTLRLRQRPGPGNALGLVKFVFPNASDVYLHGTPAVGLFQQQRRDFSHGCVRVEDPTALAEWVLRDETGWDRARIEAAMAGAVSSRVELAAPIRVVLFYTTAAVVSADGEVYFADDIYRHDARLNEALARRPRPARDR